MDDIRSYLLSVIAASVICSVALNLIDKKSAHYAVIKLLTGVFLSITVIAPLTGIEFTDLSAYFENVALEGERISKQGIETATDFAVSSISEQLEAYILDKAYSLGVDAEVEVELSEDESLSLSAVKVSGAISPYAKSKLQQIICDDLGLSEDQLIWH